MFIFLLRKYYLPIAQASFFFMIDFTSSCHLQGG